ncbi:MAG: hypothetical protein HY762_04180 [Planctomycetes bacterium]|nr:hypothetical protein [Planctomycetota bacterium]
MPVLSVDAVQVRRMVPGDSSVTEILAGDDGAVVSVLNDDRAKSCVRFSDAANAVIATGLEMI